MAPDNKYSFVEFTTADIATIALAFTGITLMGSVIRIARPKTYTNSTMPMGGGNGMLSLSLGGAIS